jgi:exo-1,4-beta-D-glucosaminidase
MLKKSAIIVLAAVAVFIFNHDLGAGSTRVASDRLVLDDGWAIQSSSEVNKGGDVLSTAGFSASGWYPASVPSTVLAALVAAGEYPHPFFGKNLNDIPGSWPPPLDTSAMPMPPLSPFRKSWWYRTEFELPREFQGKRVRLHFNGISFRADVWLNGKLIADSERVAGTYTIFEFDITDLARQGHANALAVEVFPPRHRDLAMTFVDWNPAPPDRGMGLWREVFITASGPVNLRHPHVISDLDPPDLETARLTVSAYLNNATDRTVSGTLRGRIEHIEFSRELTLGPGEVREAIFTPDDYPELAISNPRLWWPANLGPQNLYDLKLEFSAGGEVSDASAVRFGIREITSELADLDRLVFGINGKNILIRGAGWCPDMMLRKDPARLEAEVRYVKEMNMNAIRLEGKLESDEFYDICDREGILVIAGWCCCHHWERWSKWDGEDYDVAEASQRSQLLRLRRHPSLMLWMNGSDNPPPYDVEKTYLDVAEECRWPNPTVSSATEKVAKYSGPSGVKMNGPYEWVPPVYWYEDPGKYGGAWSFNTETSPGPAIPPAQSLKRMLPEDKLWPINKAWNYHAGRNMFGNVEVFTRAQDKRYGSSESLEEYTIKAQAMAYEGQRAMMEAFGRNKYTSTGVIQWMLNDAWPSIIWHLYDYYMVPAGGYFGTKKACEPLHIQYSYDDRSVVVVNSHYREFPGLTARAALYNLDMTEVYADSKRIDAAEDSSARVLTVPRPEALSTTYFLDLELTDKSGEVVSENFYWLSVKDDVLNWPLSQWHYTPTKAYADFTGLDSLPLVELDAKVRFSETNHQGTAVVDLENPTDALAFMVRLQVVGEGGEMDVTPVFWDDNYFSMLPGESRRVEAKYPMYALAGDEGCGQSTGIRISGYNVKTAVVK